MYRSTLPHLIPVGIGHRQHHQKSVLVLDLDETLVHTVPKGTLVSRTGKPNYYLWDGSMGFIRPGLKEFLSYVQRSFTHVGIWTAADARYASYIVEHVLKPLGFRPKFILAGHHCEIVRYNGVLIRIKPLRTLWSRAEYNWLGATPENTVVVDDRPETASANSGNLFQIPQFSLFNLAYDNQLAIMQAKLERWAHSRDKQQQTSVYFK